MRQNFSFMFGAELLDRFLPQFCAVCENEGEVLCKSCERRIDTSGVFLCPSCGEKNIYGARHAMCENALDGVVSLTPYSSREAQEMIRLCKYQYIESMGERMGNMLARFLENVNGSVSFFGDTVLIPVPLSARRMAERGFNQAEIIARALPFSVDTSVLKRTKNTYRQVDFLYEDRKKNVANAFLAIKKPPKKVVLIDDVATTCSTLSSCAVALKSAGCEQVWGLTFARG